MANIMRRVASLTVVKIAPEIDEDRQKADSLLMEWHRWSDMYRPKLGAPRVAPYCQQARTSKQYDDPVDLVHDKVYQTHMQAVDYCIDTLTVPMQQSIGCEARNRAANAKVWRCPGATSYSEALNAAMGVMRRKGLFD